MPLFADRRKPQRFGTTFFLLLFIALGFLRPPLRAEDVSDPNALKITSVVPKPSPPPIPLANVLAPNIDVSKYLVSEKYDGVRAVWDGSVLRFRSGNVVNAPRWFLSKLPATPLDGELWIARGKFDQLSGVVRKSIPIDDEWRQVS
jgi:DNA ligase-1